MNQLHEKQVYILALSLKPLIHQFLFLDIVLHFIDLKTRSLP